MRRQRQALWYRAITAPPTAAIPLSARRFHKVLDIFEQDAIVDHVKEVGAYLEEKLDALVDKYDCIAARRGKGLIQGLVIQGRPVGEVVLKSMDEGLIVITAGSDVLRLVPPLVITEDHVDEMVTKLERALVKG